MTIKGLLEKWYLFDGQILPSGENVIFDELIGSWKFIKRLLLKKKRADIWENVSVAASVHGKDLLR